MSARGGVLDLPTPRARAEALAESIDLRVVEEDTFPVEGVNAVLAPVSEGVDILLVHAGLPDDTRAAVIVFAASLVAGLRDGLLDPDVFRCQDGPPEAGHYIVIGSTRLPDPNVPGAGRLACLMGAQLGLTESANFEVLTHEPEATGGTP